ncbi:MAG: hypothetical protein IKZ46_16310 [Victivallales bacterium]|nr:hypothetical protein [Victivallales bacterium]
MKKLFILCMLAGLLLNAQTFELAPNGCAFIKGQNLIRSVRPILWDKSWTNNTLDDNTPADSALNSVALSLTVPRTQNAMDFSITKSISDAGHSSLTYTATTKTSLSLNGVCILAILTPSVVAGHEFITIPNGIKGVFPAEYQKQGIHNSVDQGIAIKQDDGNYLVLSSSKLTNFLIQDDRAFQVNAFQMRFALTPNDVRKNTKYMNRMSISTVTPEQLQNMLAKKKVLTQTNVGDRLIFSHDDYGVGTLTKGPDTYVNVSAAVHGLEWAFGPQSSGAFNTIDDDDSRTFEGAITIPKTDDVPLNIIERNTLDETRQKLISEYKFIIPEKVSINGFQLSYHLMLPYYTGATLQCETTEGPKSVVITENAGERTPFTGTVKSITIKPVTEAPSIILDFGQPTFLFFQDNRAWNASDLEIRLSFARFEKGGEIGPFDIQRTITFAAENVDGPMLPLLFTNAVTSVTDTSNWFPYTLPWDAPSPLDVSFLNEKPAGKHGFIAVKGDQFITSGDGQPIRFWGTCFSAGANFPTHEQAEIVARRLASFGINMVRTHHADTQWGENSLFDKKADNTRSFDPVNLDKFDYLMYCLKREGIYIYLDQLVNRTFKKGDGVDNAEELPVCAKPYCYFDRKLIELQKEYSRNLWTHVNPYTKMAYKDDPAVAMMEFANENDLWSQSVVIEPYRTRFEAMYREWAAQNNIELPPDKVDFTQKTDAMVKFFIHVTDEYHREMGDFLRNEIGVKVPNTGSNWTRNTSLLASLAKLDYTDSHAYWNHPKTGGFFNTNSMLRSESIIMDGLGFQKITGKPFFISEWDAPWPYEFRAELPAWIAAVSAFQNWNGLTVYTYRHSSIPTDALSGSFETFNDPARFGLFPIASLIYRRGDVTPGHTVKRLVHSAQVAATTKSPSSWNYSALRSLSNMYRFEAEFTDSTNPDDITQKDKSLINGTAVASENGQILRDMKDASLIIDTPRSQVVTSFFQNKKSFSTNDMTVAIDRQFATVALSSPSDKPINQSDKLFLIVVGRAENTGFSYAFARNKMVTRGYGPILTDHINAAITIKTANPALKVYPMSNTGEKLPAVPSTYDDGKLSFTTSANTIYYIIE